MGGGWGGTTTRPPEDQVAHRLVHCHLGCLGGQGALVHKMVTLAAMASSLGLVLVYLFPKCINCSGELRGISKSVQTGIDSFFVPLLYRQ